MAREVKYTCDFCGKSIEGVVEPLITSSVYTSPPATWFFVQKYEFRAQSPDEPVRTTVGHLCDECFPRPKTAKPPEDQL